MANYNEHQNAFEDYSNKPLTTNKKVNINNLKKSLFSQMHQNKKGGIYHISQINFAYNSNKLEGSSLTYNQTKYIYETNSWIDDRPNSRTNGMPASVNVDDIIETTNHFGAFKKTLIAIENNDELKENFIKEIHKILKSGTSDNRNKEWFNVGEYKKMPNSLENAFQEEIKTTKPADVPKKMQNLFKTEPQTFNDIIKFHFDFEKIHPFQDGNGRVGRLLTFAQCLKQNHVPFIIDDYHRVYYYRGLNEFKKHPEYLIQTCKSAQEKYSAVFEMFC